MFWGDSDQILSKKNTIMAVVAFNMMKRLRQICDIIYYVMDVLTSSWSVKYATVQ